LRGIQNAPKFDGKSSAQLPRYLEDIEFLGTSANLSEEEQIHTAIRYADLNEAEVWQTLLETTAVAVNWVNFVAAVKDLYPGCEGDDRYCRADLQYSGSKNCPDVWMFFTKVNNPAHLLTRALTYECMKESPYHWLSIGPMVKGIG
jgi:hypothetical protein